MELTEIPNEDRIDKYLSDKKLSSDWVLQLRQKLRDFENLLVRNHKKISSYPAKYRFSDIVCAYAWLSQLIFEEGRYVFSDGEELNGQQQLRLNYAIERIRGIREFHLHEQMGISSLIDRIL